MKMEMYRERPKMIKYTIGDRNVLGRGVRRENTYFIPHRLLHHSIF